jgi:Spore coat assembly protein
MRIRLLLLSVFLLLLTLGACALPEDLRETENTKVVDYNIVSEKVSVSEITEAPPAAAKIDTSKYKQITNLPALYIELDDNVQLSSINKEDFVGGKYTLVNGKDVIYQKSLEMKGRGNYSWSFPKKPYALKLGTKADLLDMGDAKRWVLISNHSDKTLMRNYLTMTLAYDLGAEFSPECEFVDFFVNGKHQGTYLLTEKIQINKNRVDVDWRKSALFEIEMEYRHSGNCHYCIELPSGVHVMMVDPDEDDATDKELEKRYVEYKTLLTAADISLDKGYDEYSKYIDVDSFVDWYIVNEFVKNYDSGFTTSCFFFINREGKLTMGPVWDYDTCYGNQVVASCINPMGYHVKWSPWYTMLNNDAKFTELLHKRWTELRNDGMFDDFLEKITETADYISKSQKLDTKLWPEAMKSKDLRGDLALFTYEEELDYLITWVTRRITWLDRQWKIK